MKNTEKNELDYVWFTTAEAANHFKVSEGYLRKLREDMPRTIIIDGVETELWRDLSSKNNYSSMLRWYVPAIAYWMKNIWCK